jgi:hypothetical protein
MNINLEKTDWTAAGFAQAQPADETASLMHVAMKTQQTRAPCA